MFSTNYYIKIYPNKVVARNLSTLNSVEVVPNTPYLHPRLLIGNIDSAEWTLKAAVDQIKSNNPLKATRILVHPVTEFPGGISGAEERLFRMAVYAVLPGQVVLWVGSELTDEMVLDKIKSAK